MRRIATIMGAVGAAAVAWSGAAFASAPDDSAASQPRPHSYQVTLTNITSGEPLSPGVIATTSKGSDLHAFQVGGFTSTELAALAQDGNEAPLVNAYQAAAATTDVVDIAAPLTPTSVDKEGFSHSVTSTIQANKGDLLSIATMLVCSNDGFTGLDNIALPAGGRTATYWLRAYDAGVENNTELGSDLPDPCSAVGPTTLPGDPNGNIDTGSVGTVPTQPIAGHPGISGSGDLSSAAHGWYGPVARVDITRLN
ncbi:spondin domain-containing protein [Protofrankia symbiont of Coriaria ruscifolia]|uniref:spondin domain-containing protein n=1 Tax=Protofrankia symbiont of Coriaria ruscifolia TaxID=1306542 RepID=UPI0010414EE9|nr:spondin domain-containing protein [Protofrankia symbiont of Coriaria ruscifolia]